MSTPQPHDQLTILAALLDQMPAYLASDAVFRPVMVQEGGLHQTATLTIGNVLDLFKRLGDLGSGTGPGTDRQRLAELRSRFDVLRTSQHAAYGAKLGRELKGQLDSWRWSVDDAVRGGDGPGGDDRPDPGLRARIEQLLTEAKGQGIDVTEARRRMAELDERLRSTSR